MIAFHPFCAHTARARISRSDPNCLFLVGNFILESGLGGSILDTLVAPEAAELGRSWSLDGVGMRSVGVGSRPNEDDIELIRESEAISGDRGGANPVMQSITRTRGGLVTEVADPFAEDDEDALLRRSSSVTPGRRRRSTRCTVVYV